MSGFVFISYSQGADRTYVDALAAFLADSGITCWFDRETQAGQVWTKTLQARLDSCAAVLVIMTPEADRSEWVDREINYAQRIGKPIVPLLLRGKPFFTLVTSQYHDVRGERMPSASLLSVLHRHIAAPAVDSAEPERQTTGPVRARTATRGGAGTRAPRTSDIDGFLAGAAHDDLFSYIRARPIFLQYMNPEILACYGLTQERGYSNDSLANALRATRLAVLATDDAIVFPASYFREVQDMPQFLAETESLSRSGRLQFTSSTENLSEYFESKASEYRADSRNPYESSATAEESGVRWRPRHSASTATDITKEWVQSIYSEGGLSDTVRSLHKRWPARHGDISTVLEQVPERLDGQAFIERFVEPHIPVELRGDERGRIAMFISRSYLASYLEDLDANIVADFEFGGLSCWVERASPSMAKRVLSARRFDAALSWIGLDRFVHEASSWDDLVSLSAAPEFGTVAIAMQHVCPVEPFRRVAVQLRQSSALDSRQARSLKDALATSSMVATELLRLDHPGI